MRQGLCEEACNSRLDLTTELSDVKDQLFKAETQHHSESYAADTKSSAKAIALSAETPPCRAPILRILDGTQPHT